jgi:hypothetical protein
MSGLFGSPFASNTTLKEGIVVSVDPIRYLCSVRMSGGQTYPNVTWITPTGGSGKDGSHSAPNQFDKVLVCMSTASPIIVGTIPRMGVPDSNPTSISGTNVGVDSGNSSDLSNGNVLNPNKPADFLPGDKVWTSASGSVMGLLASGSVLLKSSQLAQIFISRFNGLVRIVARNFYRFSDASSEVSANVKGALYRWIGVDWDLGNTTTNSERYNEVVGHVAAGKQMRGEPSSLLTVPARDSRVKETWLKDANGNEVMIETVYEDGKVILIVKQVDGGTTTTTTDDSLWKTSVVNGTTSTITILPASIEINHNDISKVFLDGSHINLDYNGTSTINLDATGIQANALGHFFVIDSTGSHLG